MNDCQTKPRLRKRRSFLVNAQEELQPDETSMNFYDDLANAALSMHVTAGAMQIRWEEHSEQSRLHNQVTAFSMSYPH